jgi:hypothetical protein
VDTVALCGGSVAGEFVWMVDGVDYATAWVEVRAMWGRGQAGTLAALQDVEESLPFALLGLDSDNGGEFINYHVMSWLQKRARPVFMTRSRPYKKDDKAHVEQKNWTHIRQWFGYERHDNPAVVELINQLAKGPYGQWLNYFHASLKLESKEKKDGRVRRIYGDAQTPLARVLASAQVSQGTKVRLRAEKGCLNLFALKEEVSRGLKVIAAIRQAETLGKRGDYIAADKELEAALESLPENGEAKQLLADWKVREPQQFEHLRQERLARGKKLFDSVLARFGDADLFESHELKTGKPVKAVESAILEALKIHPAFRVAKPKSNDPETFEIEAVQELTTALGASPVVVAA